MSDVLEPPDCGSKISKCKLQELNDLLAIVGKERRKCIEGDIFTETLLEGSHQKHGINKSTLLKIKDIVIRQDLISHYERHNEDAPVISEALEDFENVELTFDEQSTLKPIVELLLQDKYNRILKHLNKRLNHKSNSLEPFIDIYKHELTDDEQQIKVSHVNVFNDKRKTYIDGLMKLGERLKELVDLRVNVVPRIMEVNSDEMYMESEKCDLRLKLLELRVNISMFTERPLTMDAYRVAMKDLENRQSEISAEIECYKKDICDYEKLVGNDKYQEVLEEYKQYKGSLKTKMWLYQEMKK